MSCQPITLTLQLTKIASFGIFSYFAMASTLAAMARGTFVEKKSFSPACHGKMKQYCSKKGFVAWSLLALFCCSKLASAVANFCFWLSAASRALSYVAKFCWISDLQERGAPSPSLSHLLCHLAHSLPRSAPNNVQSVASAL